MNTDSSGLGSSSKVVALSAWKKNKSRRKKRVTHRKNPPSTPLELALGAAIALEQFYCVIEVAPKEAQNLKPAVDALRRHFRSLGVSFDKAGRPRLPASIGGGGFEFDGASTVHVRAMKLAADAVCEVLYRRRLGNQSSWADDIITSMTFDAFRERADIGLRLVDARGNWHSVVRSVVARSKSTGQVIASDGELAL